MEFRDLKEQYKQHKEAIDKAVLSVINDANFIHGKQVSELECALAEYVGVKHCITCANGTDALQLALMSWNIGIGDAIFVPDFTFFSSGEVVPLVGAVPVFVDIDIDTYNISAESLESAIQYVLEKTNLKPRAIVAVDLFGQPAEFDRIRKIARKYNLLLLEDAAQSFGAQIGERKACSFGDISTTSFFPAKPLGCYGDGGAIFTNNDAWAELLKSLCVHGKGTDKYDNIRVGLNSRLDTIQAAVLLEKLKFFEEEVDRCNVVADEYTALLKDVVKTPHIIQGMRSSWSQYTVCARNSKEREMIIQRLKEKGVPTAIYYRKPMHVQRAFKPYVKEITVDYSITEDICKRCFSLPMHGYMRCGDVQKVCEVMLGML